MYLRSSFRILREITARSVFSLFATVQPKGQPAVDAINNYQSLVSLLNTSTQMALAANRKIQDTLTFLPSVDQQEAAVNQSVATSKALQQTIEQLNSSFAASGNGGSAVQKRQTKQIGF